MLTVLDLIQQNRRIECHNNLSYAETHITYFRQVFSAGGVFYTECLPPSHSAAVNWSAIAVLKHSIQNSY